jgi:hypothetical protein
MAQREHTAELALLEEAITVLFCEVDDVYAHLNPKGQLYASLKRLSDSEVITLALFQQLRGMDSERRFLARGRSLFPPSLSWDGGPSSIFVPSPASQAQTLPGVSAASHLTRVGGRSRDHDRRLDAAFGFAPPAQVSQGSGFDGAAWVRWGTFSVYGVKLHLLCVTNRVPICYELTPFRTWRRSLSCGGVGCRSKVERADGPQAAWGSSLPERAVGGRAGRSGHPLSYAAFSRRRPGARQQIEIAFASLKRVFGVGETLATTLTGLARRIAAKITAYTYAFLVNRRLSRPQGRIKELWA